MDRALQLLGQQSVDVSLAGYGGFSGESGGFYGDVEVAFTPRTRAGVTGMAGGFVFDFQEGGREACRQLVVDEPGYRTHAQKGRRGEASCQFLKCFLRGP